MCAGVCACVTGYSNPARSGKGLPALRSLYVSFCGCHQRLRGDGLFSFNSKLAVLVSEPDVQIKKVRHAHLILVNLPLHISPACQLMWQQPSQTHAFALCTPPPHTPLLCKAVVFLFCKIDNFTSLRIAIDKSKTVSSFQNVTTGWRWTLELFVYILEEC